MHSPEYIAELTRKQNKSLKKDKLKKNKLPKSMLVNEARRNCR